MALSGRAGTSHVNSALEGLYLVKRSAGGMLQVSARECFAHTYLEYV